MKLFKSIWKRVVACKNAVVYFFTDKKGYIGPGIGKANVIEILSMTALFAIPLPINNAVAMPLRIMVGKAITLLIVKYTFMKSNQSENAIVRSLMICLATLCVVAGLVYGLELAISSVLVGAALNVLITFLGN